MTAPAPHLLHEHVEGGAARDVGGVAGRAAAQQQLGGVGAAEEDCVVEGGPAGGVRQVGARPRLQQQFHKRHQAH